MSSIQRQEVEVTAGTLALPGTLMVPEHCIGGVIFAHGSGSSRFSRRNQAVAEALVQRGCATLLFDLLTEAEAPDRSNVFDIPLLGERMAGATRWLSTRHELRGSPIGYFGASTGAAAALVAAAAMPDTVASIVSRGGRPDLAGEALPRVTSPTLLIVGSLDASVIELNRHAQQRLTNAENELVIVDGASHLFEEPGKLEEVATLAADWFNRTFSMATTRK